jgi:hypothetical protein
VKDKKEKTAEEKAEIKRVFQIVLKRFHTRPIKDQRLWIKNIYAAAKLVWDGPEPDQWSPATLAEEQADFDAVLFGTRPPRNSQEQDYLDFMGGVRERQGQKKWITCRWCSGDFVSYGFPAPFRSGIPGVRPSDGRFYPTICEMCGDMRDAVLTTKPETPPKPEPPPANVVKFSQHADP